MQQKDKQHDAWGNESNVNRESEQTVAQMNQEEEQMIKEHRRAALRYRLNLWFIILAFATMGTYIFAPAPVARPLYYVMGFASIIIKMVEVYVRTKDKKNTK